MSRPILVTGSQRSGTSIVAGILFHSGIFMGNWFLKKDIHNPTGYFEDTEFGNLDEARYRCEISKTQWKKQARELIKQREQVLDAFPRWGWKAPSSALYVHHYIKLADPLIIHCTRDREKIIESMKKMYWPEPEKYLNEVEEVLKDVPKLVVDTDNLRYNTEYEVGRIMGYLNYSPPPKKLKKAIAHVVKAPDLKHQQVEHYQDCL